MEQLSIKKTNSIPLKIKAELCQISAMKHKHLASWIAKEFDIYEESLSLRVTDVCSEHMPTKRLIITRKMCEDKAGLYSSDVEWARRDAETYQVAKLNNWKIK